AAGVATTARSTHVPIAYRRRSTSRGDSVHPAAATRTARKNGVRHLFCRDGQKRCLTPFFRAGITRNRLLPEPPLDGVEQSSSDIDAELPIQFTYSGRARDVDLGDEVADDVEPGEQHAFRGERRSDLVREPAVARRERPALAARAHHEVAARLPGGRDAGERGVDRLAVDQQHPLVAVEDRKSTRL